MLEALGGSVTALALVSVDADRLERSFPEILDELPAALAAAERVKDAAIRDSLPERFAALGAHPTVDDVVEMNRAVHR